MKGLTLLPLSISYPLHTHHHSFSPTNLCNPIFWPKLYLTAALQSTILRHKTLVLASNSGDPKKESAFLDENGAVDDMDGYLNNLSLEYDSVWDTKPSWCQPWTITLTGVLITTSSWLVLHSVIVTPVVLSLVCLWWYIFLYSYPKAYSDMIAERRKKVTIGAEDTFGLSKNQLP